MRWCCVVLAGLAMILVGCGGSGGDGGEPASASTSKPPPKLTPAAVKRCLSEGASEMRLAPPLAPKGSPLNTPAFYGIGPGGSHVGVILSPNARIAARIKKLLDLREEYVSVVARQGRAIMLVDSYSPRRDKELVEECVQGIS